MLQRYYISLITDRLLLQIFISLYIGCIAYEEKNIFGKVLLILRLYKYVYMCELTLFLINWQLCYP